MNFTDATYRVLVCGYVGGYRSIRTLPLSDRSRTGVSPWTSWQINLLFSLPSVAAIASIYFKCHKRTLISRILYVEL